MIKHVSYQWIGKFTGIRLFIDKFNPVPVISASRKTGNKWEVTNFDVSLHDVRSIDLANLINDTLREFNNQKFKLIGYNYTNYKKGWQEFK